MITFGPRLLGATAVGLALTGSFIGVSWSLTYIAIPTLLVSPPDKRQPAATPSSSLQPLSSSDHLARQYKRIYDIGAVVGPVVSGLSASSFIYAFRQLPTTATYPRHLFLAAAVLNVAIGPFTGIAMSRTNNELHRRSREASAGQDEAQSRKDAKGGSVQSLTTPELLQWWGYLNALRGWIQVGGFACAATALII
jgi:Domain of unknown function (DUF1772)